MKEFLEKKKKIFIERFVKMKFTKESIIMTFGFWASVSLIIINLFK